MPEGYNPLWSHNFMVNEDDPELATNEEWRGIMVRARKAHGLSQDALAGKLRASQALISKIESGEVSSSSLVLPICRLLSIPLPEHFVDEFERSWVQLGRALRHRSPNQAKATLELIKSIVEQAGEPGAEEKRDAIPDENK